jgi:hypothetical protein
MGGLFQHRNQAFRGLGSRVKGRAAYTLNGK